MNVHTKCGFGYFIDKKLTTEARGIQGLRSNCDLFHRWLMIDDFSLIEAVEMVPVDLTWTDPVNEWVKAGLDEWVKVRVSVPSNACARVACSQQAGGSVTSLTDWWFSVEHWTLMIITELCWLKSYSLSVSTNYPDWHAAVCSCLSPRGLASPCPLSLCPLSSVLCPLSSVLCPLSSSFNFTLYLQVDSSCYVVVWIC